MKLKTTYYAIVLSALSLVILSFYLGINEKSNNLKRNQILLKRVTDVEAKIATLTNNPVNRQNVEVNVTSIDTQLLPKDANEVVLREFQKTKQQLLTAYPGLRIPGDIK